MEPSRLVSGHTDRYALVVLLERCTRRDIDHHLVTTLMHWWTSRRDADSHPQCLQQQCWYCGRMRPRGRQQFCYDHAFPQDYVSTPLVPCCWHCNSQKRHLTPYEYRRFRPQRRFWFEQSDLAISPLGAALCEDLCGVRQMLIGYLIERSMRHAAVTLMGSPPLPAAQSGAPYIR
jgi:hypothetical protein